MKITITPANSTFSLVVDGTQQELAPLLNNLLNIATPISSVKPTLAPSASTTPAAVKHISTSAPVISNNDGMAFVDSLFVLRADAQGNRAVGRRIAYHLMDCKPHTYKQILSKFGCSEKTIDKLYTNLLRAGADITRGYNAAGQRYIHVSAYPAVASSARRARKTPKKPAVKAASRNQDPALRALVGKKIPSNRTTR